MPSLDVSTLDPGVRDTVTLLRAHGFDTTDSGDGVSKPPEQRVFDVPHVACRIDPARLIEEAKRAQSVLGSAWRVEVSYCSTDEQAVLIATREGEEQSTSMPPPLTDEEWRARGCPGASTARDGGLADKVRMASWQRFGDCSGRSVSDGHRMCFEREPDNPFRWCPLCLLRAHTVELNGPGNPHQPTEAEWQDLGRPEGE